MPPGGPDLVLAAATPLFDSVARGKGGVVLIDGAPGTGRTTAINHAADLARRSRLRVVAARCVPSGSDSSFAVARTVGEELRAKVAWPAAVTSGTIAEVAASLLDASEPDDDWPGTCILVDDASWADEASLRTLLHVTRRVHDRAVALVLAAGPDRASSTVADVLDELRASPGTVLVPLGPLAAADVAALVEASVGPDTEPSVRDHLLHRTGGNPFLLTALLEHLATSPTGRPLDPVVPERVRAHVAARISRLGSDATALARAAHVLGHDATLVLAASLAGLTRRAAEDAADGLAAAAVFRPGAPLAFREPLVGDAVGAGLDSFALDRWHRESAELLVANGRPVDRVAAHLLRTTPTGQRWVVEQLRLAADAANEIGDCAAAATLLRRAVDEPPAAEDQPAVLSELAFAESRAGLPDAVEHINQALAAVQAPDTRLMLLRERARLLWLTGHLPEAVETCELAISEAEPGTDLHDQLLAELLAVASMHDVSPIYARPQLVALLDRGSTGWVPESPALAATLATVLPFVLGDLRLVGPLVDRAREEDLWRPDATPFGMRPDFVIGSLWLSDNLERGTRIAREGMARVEEDNLFRHGLLHYWLGEIRYAAGDLPGAIEATTAAIEPRWGPIASWIGFSTATLTHAYLDLDDRRRAEETLASVRGLFDPEQLYGIALDLARARLLIRSDGAEEAAELAEQIGERLAVLGHRDSPQITWRPIAVTASAAVGATARACVLIDEEIELARRTHALGRLGRALRTKAAVGEPSERPDLLRAAVEVLRGSERRLEHARALLASGIQFHADGDMVSARGALTEAREMAEACGASPVANDALVALHATGARPRRTARSGLDSLTGAERRAVELAASGKTNREIGETLHIAPRTVEWHLGRAFTKLGVQSRRDLSAALERES